MLRSVLYLALGGPLFVAYVALTVLFWKRRKLHPLVGRQPLLVVVSALVLVLYIAFTTAVEVAVDHGTRPSCTFTYLAAIYCEHGITLSYLLRAYRLWFRSNLAHEQLLHVEHYVASLTTQSVQHVTPPSTWFSRHRRWGLSSTTSKMFAVLWTALVVVPSVVFVIVDPHTDSSCPMSVRSYYSLGLFFVWVVAAVFLAYSLRDVADGYWLKQELRWSCAVGVGIMVVAAVFGTQYPTASLSGSQLAIFGLSCCLGVISLLYPLLLSRSYSSYEYQEGVEDGGSTTLGQLSDVLQHREGEAAYRLFLEREFSVENLYFYKCVEGFKMGFVVCSPEENLALAEQLYDEFVCDSGPNQVNLPSSVVRELEEDLQELRELRDTDQLHGDTLEHLSHVFDAAQGVVFDLMESDSYFRFKASELYRDLVRRTNKRSIVGQLVSGVEEDEDEVVRGRERGRERATTVAKMNSSDVSMKLLEFE